MGILDKIFKRTHEKDQQTNSEQNTATADTPAENYIKSVSASVSSKTSCTHCGVPISSATFSANKGLCDPCPDVRDVQELTEQYTIVENEMAKMQECKRELQHDLITTDNYIASLQHRAQELYKVPSTLREALEECADSKTKLSAEIERVNDVLKHLKDSYAMVSHALGRLPGGYEALQRLKGER